MGAPVSTLLGAGNVLPSAAGEEPVVAAGDQFRPVLESYPVGGLHRGPMRQHLRGHVSAVLAIQGSAINRVPDPHVSQWLRAPISHQDQRVAMETVHTRVTASSIHVDGPLETEAASGGDAVEDRLGFHL